MVIRSLNEKMCILCHKVKRKLIHSFGMNGNYYLWDMKATGKIGGVKCFGPAHINYKTEIGENTAINSLQIIGEGKCIIGKHCHLAMGLTIITSSHNYKGNGISYDDTNIVKPVQIEDFVWTGANVTILPGVIIGEGAIIQAAW